MRIYLFLSIFILFFMGWIFLLEPFGLNMRNENRAQVEFDHFHFQSLNEKGREIKLSGKKAIKKNYQMFIEAPKIEKDDKLLQSERGLYDENLKKIHLEGEIFYLSPSYKFLAQKGDYYIDRSFLRVTSPFHLMAKGIDIEGKRFYYYEKSGKIIAYNIKAKIESEI